MMDYRAFVEMQARAMTGQWPRRGRPRTPRRKLLDGCKAELIDLASRGWTLLRIADHFGVSRSTVDMRLRELGRADLIGPPGRRKGNKTGPHDPVAFNERAARIVAMREGNPPMTLKAIGAALVPPVSHERVRQILTTIGRRDLCRDGRASAAAAKRRCKRVVFKCPYCGEKREMMPSQHALRKTCGRSRCRSLDRGGDHAMAVLGPRILAMRQEGKRWIDIGRIIYPDANQPSARVQQIATRYLRMVENA